MKRLLSAFLLFFLSVAVSSAVYAQSEDLQIKLNSDSSTENLNQIIIGGGFVIKNFVSEMLLEKDSSLTVKEKIEVDFLTNKHGIFRVIPDTYKLGNKTLVTPLQVISVTDGEGKNIPFQKDHYNQRIRL